MRLKPLFRRRRRQPRARQQRATQLPRILRRIVYAAGILVLMILLGTLGFYFGAAPTPTSYRSQKRRNISGSRRYCQE